MIEQSVKDLRAFFLTDSRWQQFSPAILDALAGFYKAVLDESQVQNLTRLLSPTDFYFGHLVDALELFESQMIEYPAADLGSGVGVPGLVIWILNLNPWGGHVSSQMDTQGVLGKDWVLIESEKGKADYLLRMATHFLSPPSLVGEYPNEYSTTKGGGIEVFYGRGEDYLRSHLVRTVTARAVGRVGRIYSWIRSCSTWNSLVLLKGPGWDQEWDEFQKSKWGKELRIERTHFYESGSGDSKRRLRIVRLVRVPRRT